MSKDCNQDCSSCASDCADRKEPQDLIEKSTTGANVKKVIGIVSGKGGVGKSLVTSLLASSMRKKAFNTAILDADITGPSIPKMFGIATNAKANEIGIIPPESKEGTKIMSINLILENETEPVVWRGPIIAQAVKQFWTDVIWEDIDYMFVDMPPGTGDVPLTVFQSLPVDGIIIVTSPQELVSMIVAKAANMATMVNLPILGIVENMSYFECPDCGSQHKIFGESRIEKLAKKYGIDAIARIPLDSELAANSDQGTIEKINPTWLDEIVEAIK